MRIAALKESKLEEGRVALMPSQVARLVKTGHEVFVEQDAGLNSGFQNIEYQEAGGIISDKYTALKNTELVLKVKAPLPEEYGDYRKDHVLFTFFHFDENIPVENIHRLINSGFMGIAYEWVGENKNYPLLAVMSRLTGYLFSLKAIELCIKQKGMFVGGNEPMLPGGDVLIIGLGNIGISALKMFLDNKLRITLVEKASSDELNKRLNFRFNTVGIDYFTAYKIALISLDQNEPRYARDSIAKIIGKFDIILNCAVRRQEMPKSKLEYLISAEMVKMMSRGSVICDTTACDKDLIETSVSSSLLHHIDIIHGVIHYNCDHIPALAANTATKLLTDRTFDYIKLIADK